MRIDELERELAAASERIKQLEIPPMTIGHKTITDLLDDLESCAAKTASPHFGTRDEGVREIGMVRAEILRRFAALAATVAVADVPLIRTNSKHIYRVCQCGKGNCPICTWGALICDVCGEAEGSLATNCPGKPPGDLMAGFVALYEETVAREEGQ